MTLPLPNKQEIPSQEDSSLLGHDAVSIDQHYVIAPSSSCVCLATGPLATSTARSLVTAI